jgi:hypothetical protein
MMIRRRFSFLSSFGTPVFSILQGYKDVKLTSMRESYRSIRERHDGGRRKGVEGDGSERHG